MSKSRKHAKDEAPEVRESAEANGAEAVEPEAAPEQEAVEAEAVPEPTAEQVLAAERDEFRDKWMRALAEMDNLRKRGRREVDDARRFAQADVLRPLLDVADNFERALQAMDGSEDASAQSVRQGVEMIHNSFRTVLKDRGVEAIEAAGAEFDPALHEAVAQVPSEDHESGTVIDVVQQGYRLGDLVLRPARVVIAS
jgi:molecular chaperone GrpE